MTLSIIAAHDPNLVIGNNGGLPWHYSEDLKFFKKTTMGFPLIMGRVVFEELNVLAIAGAAAQSRSSGSCAGAGDRCGGPLAATARPVSSASAGGHPCSRTVQHQVVISSPGAGQLVGFSILAQLPVEPGRDLFHIIDGGVAQAGQVA